MEILTEHRKKLFVELARDAALDLGFYYGIPWVKKKMGGTVTAEDRVIAAQAREHVAKGEHDEARKVLVRHMMGWGLYDEQMFDENLEAVTRAHLATRAQVSSLEAWLAADQRRRSRFRNTLTLQDSPQSRMRVIADYAKMTNVQRSARLLATGKLDDQFDEKIWNWVKINIPGMTRQVWDGMWQGIGTAWAGCAGAAGIAYPGIRSATLATGRGIAAGTRAVRGAAVSANNGLDAWGLALQAAHPRPAIQPPSEVWGAVKRFIR
jgi:hypothetical protein